MKSTSIPCKDTIRTALQQCRSRTLKLFEKIDDTTFYQQIHPDFSPIGWHLGHIGYTEALWLLEFSAQYPPLFPQYRQLYAADGLPKKERVKLPTPAQTREQLEIIREKVLKHLENLEIATLQKQERLWHFIIQHESQHGETIAILLHLQQWHQKNNLQIPQSPNPCFLPKNEMIEIPAGSFEMGSDAIEALDNERARHYRHLETYWIDTYPVTCGQYREFIAAGGYDNPKWWSQEGWQWLQANAIKQPLYWIDNPALDNHPVYGVSWYEADAYSRFVGKRLPTEAEWEKAASWDAANATKRLYPWGEAKPTFQCNHDILIGGTTPVNAYPEGVSFYGCYDMLGNVWEWTSSFFEGYEGFQFYPYPGYSQIYFDGKHRVLKGGSWATRPWVLRCSFRNWYHPEVRQILAGFRCVKSK